MSIRHTRVFETTSSKAIVMIILLTMSLMRIVWLQVRPYSYSSTLTGSVTLKAALSQYNECHVQDKFKYSNLYAKSPDNLLLHAWLASPGYTAFVKFMCKDGIINMGKLVDWNRFFIVGSAILMVFLVRFLTSSWVLAVGIGAALISRGELLSKNGLISHDGVMMFITTSWFAFASHFFKTAASFSLYGMILSFIAGALFDKIFLVVGLSFPVFVSGLFLFKNKLKKVFLWKRQGGKDQPRSSVASLDVLGAAIIKTEQFWMKTMNRFSKQMKNLPSFDPSIAYKRGTVFRTLSIPFGLWVLQKRRWFRIMLGWIFILLMTSGLVYFLQNSMVEMSPLTTKNFADVNFQLYTGNNLYLWLNSLLDSVDFYYAMSFSVLLACLLTPPHPQFVAVIEVVWLFALSFIGIVLTSFLVNSFEYSIFTSLNKLAGIESSQFGVSISNVFYWFEPTMLTIGIVGIFYLAKSVYLSEARN